MKMKKSFKIPYKSLVVLVLAAAAVYYVWFRPIPVEAVKVGFLPVVAEALGTGTLEARLQTMISPKITGRLAEIPVDQGDKVVKGQVVLTLDDEDLRQQVAMAQAELAAAQASLENAAAAILRTQAIIKEAQSSLTRYETLVPAGAASQADLDSARQKVEVAQAELRQMQAAKIAAEKNVAKAQAAQDYAQTQLTYAVVRAPFDGLIVRRHHDPGNIVVPGSRVLELISLDELWIEAWVDETLLSRLEVDQPAKIILRSHTDAPLPGHVVRIAPQADSETREVRVDVGIDQLPANWAVGQRAEVYIETGRRDKTLAIPQRVIVWQQQQAGVYLIEKGKTRWQRITLGMQGKMNVEVIEGLQEGQTLMIPAVQPPRDGQAVRVKESTGGKAGDQS